MDEHEQNNLCEECGVNEASCTVAMVMGGKTLHRHLCQACMSRIGMTIASGNIQQLLGAFMAAAKEAAREMAQEAAEAGEEIPAAEDAPLETEPETAEEADAPATESVLETACPVCGLTLRTFRTTGTMGCAACYEAFRGGLMPLMRSRCPVLQHVGRRPLVSEAARQLRARQEDLQHQLEQAVAQENFEMAARLRDALRALSDGEENA